MGCGPYYGSESDIQAPYDLHGYFWPFLTWEVGQINFDAEKGFLEGVIWEENKGNEHGFSRRRLYVIVVLEFLKIFI